MTNEIGSRAWMAEVMETVFQECREVRGEGQKEYAHDEGNAFGNFDRTGEELNLPPEKVLWIFMRKHLDGIKAHINGHESQREDVSGRIKDAITYLCLLRGLVERKRAKRGKA